VIRAALIALFCAAMVSAQVKPVLRASIQERNPIIVGQPVHLKVLVLVPN
jgi:hypothetical protein